MKKLVIISILCGFSLSGSYSQSTGDNIYFGGKYLGFDASQGVNILPFRTNSIQRMAMNGNLTNNINSQGNANRSGFLGLGGNIVGSPANSWNTNGPVSLLHLMGNCSIQPYGGYRNWMRYGITLTHNNDMMWMGQRQNGADFSDVTDNIIAWADNPGNTDNLLFVFSTGTGSGNNDLTGDHPNGREIMRLNTNGNVGIGPRFSNAAQPQSQFHINAENLVPVWLQLSSQNGTGQAATDGLRMGLNNAVGYIFNQENSHLIFSTNASTVSQLALERMRISHVGAPGIPATAANGSTRVAVSLTPTSPLTAPRSLMHIGAPLSGQGGSTDGVRNWMNVGYLSTFDSDNMYVGLKNEGADY